MAISMSSDRPIVDVGISPGATSSWSISGTCDVLDLGEWLDAIIRNVHKSGGRVRITIDPPEPGLMGTVAERTVRRVLDVFETVEERKP